MTKKKTSRKTSPNIGNPFTLLASSYKSGDIVECMNLLTGIYIYLCRQVPPRSIRRQWQKEFNNTRMIDQSGRAFSYAVKDFTIKNVAKFRDFDDKMYWGGCYFVRLHTNYGGNGATAAWLDYSTEANSVGIDGFRSRIAKRGRQLMGYREEVKK